MFKLSRHKYFLCVNNILNLITNDYKLFFRLVVDLVSAEEHPGVLEFPFTF